MGFKIVNICKRFFAAFVPIFLGLSAAAAAVQADGTYSITVPSVQTPPKIDGTLNDPEWKNAAHVQLKWDFAFRRAADEPTDAYLLADARNLYVAFVAKQKQPIVATQHQNDQPLGSDDVVRVYLWPAGDSGNEYFFAANPIGTRYAFSTENTAFSPAWDAVGTTQPDGYIVTERIPINTMRGDGRGTWRVQFDRRIRTTNQVIEWAYDAAQGGTDTVLYAGYLHGMEIASRNARTKPRIAVYGLGEYAPAALGGSTSRTGLDLALPITQTSSFIATFHPDYSNVELDQQSIAPTAFPRRFQEVRPFFTQGGNFYNSLNCNDCLNYPYLYTPGIPTPRTGYAMEGKQGNVTFAGFDAVGAGRNDNAQYFQWRTKDRKDDVVYQRVGVDLPGLHDVADYLQGTVGNYHNFSAYATIGNEHGTQVTRPGEGRYNEYGVNFYTAKSGLFAAWHDVGSQYAPYDAFNQISDVHGPSVYMYREFDNSAHSFIQSLTPSIDFASYRDSSGVKNYAYDSFSLSANTRNLWTMQLITGSSYLRFPNSPGGLTNTNGVYLAYGASTSTPQSITYFIGRYGAGFLHTTDLESAIRVTRRGTLSFSAYNTNQQLDTGESLKQWLERVSFAYQIGPGESVALGWRRIIGNGPTFFTAPDFIDGTNLSLAYYRRIHGFEMYFAYGTPNTLSTQHDVIFKIIRYIGADKGT
jgi:hypothetical protein